MTICTACASENPDGAKFCLECGTPVAPRACPSCGSPVGRGRFCGECGAAVDGSAPPAKSAGPVAERRVTSVLFADLVGFTPLSESRDAEEVRELLSRYFAECRTVIARYGGTVEKFIGDAVMAVWGVPIAHEDDAERSVRAGLELARVTAAMGEDVGAPGLAMRVGIVTGEVAVTVGATAEGMVAGDAVNTAARVQSAAEPGQVWVDETTRSLTSAAIAYADAGEHLLKGKAEPLRLNRAVAVVAAVGGAQRVDGLEAPLAGRTAELRLLKEMFHGTEDSGRPRLLLLDGEAGVGKSRLAWEFEKYADGLSTSVRWHRGRCLSYGDGVAFWSLGEAVRGRLGLVESDTGTVVTQLLDEWLQANVPDRTERDWLAPRVATLLGEVGTTFTRDDLFAAWSTFFERVGAEQPVVIVLDDVHHADDALLDFLDFLVSTAQTSIFVLALARPELLQRRPALATGRRSVVIHLEPLETADMATLVDGLVDGLPRSMRESLVTRAEGIPLFAVETVRALVDRDLVIASGGRYMLAEGVDVDLAGVAAPASLQALVASRLDALTPSERRVVADASVLGASFTREGIGVLAEDVPELDDILESLRRKEIFALQTDRLSAERGQFRFMQSVVRQVAYATQGRRDRKERHLAVAAFLQTLPDPGDDFAALVAQHLLDAVQASSAGDADVPDLSLRAKELLVRAAERSLSVGSPSDALDLLRSALQLVDDATERCRLLESAATAARDAGRFPEAITMAREAVQGWQGLGDPVGAGRAAALEAEATSYLAGDRTQLVDYLRPHWEALVDLPDAESALLPLAAVLARLHAQRDEHEASRTYLERQLRIAEAVGDTDQLATALLRLANILSVTGAPEAGAIQWRAVADYAASHDLSSLHAQLCMLVAIYDLPRDLAKGQREFREALEIAKRSGAMPRINLVKWNLGFSLWTSGDWPELESIIEDLEESDESFNTQFLLTLGGWLDAAKGRIRQRDLPGDVAQGAMEVSIDAWTLANQMVALAEAGDAASSTRAAEQAVAAAVTSMGLEDDFGRVWPIAVLGALHAGSAEVAARLLDPVRQAPRGLVTPYVGAQYRLLKGLVGAALDADPAEVESDFRAGIAALDAYGAVPERARGQESLGRWLVSQGRAAEAQPLIEQARTTYSELGAFGWLARLDDDGEPAEWQSRAKVASP